jgi:hypothetical protein
MVHYLPASTWKVKEYLLRSDNCIKNHFYSKLRKTIRKLNKIILEHFVQDFRELKEKTLYKIIETQ